MKLNKVSGGESEQAWKATFESVVDSIFGCVGQTNTSAQFKDSCLELLLQIVQRQPRERLSALSKKNSSLQIRDKILLQILNIYNTLKSSTQVEQVTYCNQICDDILEALSYKSEVIFVCQTVGALVFEEDSPKLQALLRIIINRVKAINQQQREEDKKVKDEFKYESF